ncbi:MAG: monooxygenase [Dermatophilaceae bacterium]|nr:monooxygenase [Dermatophilaceae bacterium]
MRTRRGLPAVAVAAAALLAAACGAPTTASAPPAAATSTKAAALGTTGHTGSATPGAAPSPLRAGESLRTVTAPVSYTPKAPTTGTDDYRCFVLDPRLTKDQFVTGFDIAPGQPDEVHHVILFRVPPSAASAARARDADSGGKGWTCFGGAGLGSRGATLDDAPWVGAWAPGGRENVLPADVGIPMERGSLLVMQVHYNLRHGVTPDRTSVKLRLSSSPGLKPLETMLYPAPVELPCRPGKSGPLCDRSKAIADVTERFGAMSPRMVNGLLLVCDGTLLPSPGPTQSCTRTVERAATVRAVAGHMHLLGSSLRIELNPDTASARTLLDIKTWDFDNQGAVPIPATKIKPGDSIRVSCTHDQAWRDKLPDLQGLPERYVVWGEGTTDEMCLGLLSVTRP